MVTIRPATGRDRPGICAVHLRAIRETCARAYSPARILAWASLLSPDSYTAVLQPRVVVVATDATGVVGFGQLDPGRHEAEAVYVRPERQGDSIGRRLLDDLEAHARARGIDGLELSATLNATAFCQRAGYTVGHLVTHRLSTGEELECVRMSKDLHGPACPSSENVRDIGEKETPR
jgi:GNAT superfamily N-acetyltransferase